MTLNEVVAAILFLGVVAYAIFAGADFGTGVWDLTAGNAERGGPLRAQIDRSIGPVWEANHVWLIFVLVFLWSGFPTAFAAIMTTLFVPWMLVGLGIVLRGAAFAFRKFAATVDEARLEGAVFASSSVITPFFLGMIAGGIADGRVPLKGGDIWSSWTGPTSWVGGTLAVLTCSFLAATFLAADAERSHQPELAAQCGRNALWTGVVTGAVALSAVFPLRADADTLVRRLEGRGSVPVVASAIAGFAALVLLRQKRWAIARVAAVAAVAAIVIGWGVGQYPDVLVDHATINDVAGAHSTMVGLVVTFGIAAVTVIPSLLWLFALVQRAPAGPTGPAAS
ncbi:MAG: cytochrome d ubiquinol oxidase subunit II [Ilumatobacteraceae bacterium]|nr:cytochrome d ubiquinol oxidase subunit II [Ilumatobacteraceae bacterium]